MITQFKSWYTIDEVAEIFECKVEDIIHFIQAGKLNTVFWLNNEPAIIDDGDGNRYDILINGLWASLSSMRYGLGHGDMPVIYSIDADNPEKGFEDTFDHIVPSWDEALECKKNGFHFIFAGIIQEKYILATSVTRIYGDSRTAKDVVLKKELEKFKSIVNMNQSFQQKKSVSKREEKTDLKIISALVSIVREQTDMKSQAQIIDHIINHDQFKRIPGLSSRTIEGRFALANKALEDAGD